MSNCTHQDKRQVWIPESGERGDYEYEDGHWESVTENYYVDIDTHRYKCTKCGEVFWYSQAAKEGRI